MNAAANVNTARDMYVFVDDIMALTGLAKSKSYDIIRQLNEELEAQGIYTIQGRVSRKYFYQRFGFAEEQPEKRGKKKVPDKLA